MGAPSNDVLQSRKCCDYLRAHLRCQEMRRRESGCRSSTKNQTSEKEEDLFKGMGASHHCGQATFNFIFNGFLFGKSSAF